MKTLFQLITFKTILFLLSFVAISSNTKAAHSKDSVFCLKIKGRIVNADEGYSPGCKVELLTNKGVVDSTIIRSSRNKFSFKLKRNTYYAIRVSKSGYVTRLISINTAFPTEIHDLCEFSFDTQLLAEEDAKEMNHDALDFPVALVH